MRSSSVGITGGRLPVGGAGVGGSVGSGSIGLARMFATNNSDKAMNDFI